MRELSDVASVLVLRLVPDNNLRKSVVKGVKESPARDPSVIHLHDLVMPCLREAFIDRWFGCPPPVTLKRYVREASKEPILHALSKLGWGVRERFVKNCGSFTLIWHVDAVYRVGNEVKVVAQISFSGVKAGPMKALVATAVLLNASTAILIDVNPQGTLRCLRTHIPANIRAEVNEAIMRKAEALHKALKNGTPPPPEHGSWCKHCLSRKLCEAMKSLGVVTHA